MFGKIPPPKALIPKDLPLIKKLAINETMKELLTLVSDPDFLIKYELQDDRKGYRFLFPKYTSASVWLNTAFQNSNIHETKNVNDNEVAEGSWNSKFYFWLQLVQQHRFDQKNGLDVEVAYQLAKKCCARFNITLCEDLDCKLPKRGELPKPVVEKPVELAAEEDTSNMISTKEIEAEALVVLDIKIKRDFEFLQAFDEEFKVNSFFVIETFGTLLDHCSASELMEDIKSIWKLVKQKDDDDILCYLSLVRNYVYRLQKEKDHLQWQGLRRKIKQELD